jgi:hypothetical protein
MRVHDVSIKKATLGLFDSSFTRHDSFSYDSIGLVEHRITFTVQESQHGDYALNLRIF